MSDKSDLLDVLHNIVANARLVPDPSMQGTTDIYAVPLDDIEEAQRLLKGIVLSAANRSKESMQDGKPDPDNSNPPQRRRNSAYTASLQMAQKRRWGG